MSSFGYFALGASVAIDSVGATVFEDTFKHHSEWYRKMDVDKTVEDYSEDAHLTNLNHLTGERDDYYGKDGVRKYYIEKFSRAVGPDGLNHVRLADGFDIEEPKADGNTAFLAWACSDCAYDFHWGTDTFVMRSDGKITHHNIYYSGSPRGHSARASAETQPAMAISSPAETIYEKTWDHHADAFMGLDVGKKGEDYSEHAHLVMLNHMTGERQDYYGKDGASDMFSLLYSRIAGPDGSNALGFADGFEIKGPKVDGNTMLLAWNCSTSAYEYHWATDTFVMGSDGKFTHHNIYYSGTPRDQSDVILA